MVSFLIRGLVLGLTAAIQPGPFQAYLISQTLQNGWQRTIWTVFAPLISDGPIITLVLLILTQVPDRLLSVLQIAGGVFLLYLAHGAYRGSQTAESAAPPGSTPTQQNIFKAALMNALSPGPYIFWTTVGGTIFINGWRSSPGWGASFLLGFYITLIGGLASFVLLAAMARRLGPQMNYYLGLFSAVALCGFGFYQLGSGATALLFK